MSAPGDSMDRLKDAVKARLIAALGLKPGECDVTPDGKPNPSSGPRFFAVWGGSVSNSQKHALDETYSFKVTVTVWTAAAPRDRKRDGGVWALALRARAALHMNEAVRVAAGDGFTVPPVFESANDLGPQGPDWFWAEPTGTGRDPTGMAVELSFGQCRRIAYIEEDQT